MNRGQSCIFLWLFCFFLVGCSLKNQPSNNNFKLLKQEGANEKINYLQESAVQLTTPQVFVDSLIFAQASNISMDLDLEGSEIFYSINQGSAQKYYKPIQIFESSSLKVEAKRAGNRNSEPVEFRFIKAPKKETKFSIYVAPEASTKYPGGGPQSFVDLKKGTKNFKEGNLWSGFQEEEIEIILEFEKPQSINKIHLSFLEDHNSWIFLPHELKVWGEEKLVGEKKLHDPLKALESDMKFVELELSDGLYTRFRINILSKDIPEWHAGVGTTPWLFLDEIIWE